MFEALSSGRSVLLHVVQHGKEERGQCLRIVFAPLVFFNENTFKWPKTKAVRPLRLRSHDDGAKQCSPMQDLLDGSSLNRNVQ